MAQSAPHAAPAGIEPAPPRRSHRRILIGLVVGGALGFAYHYFIGCSTGACPITARWWTASLYGALIGFLMTRT